ncbi:MAG: hypothetical protein HUU34_03545 [Saprospiraceae bacterium]|nr:hypothetical protein [Saprospiraceae bacterium]
MPKQETTSDQQPIKEGIVTHIIRRVVANEYTPLIILTLITLSVFTSNDFRIITEKKYWSEELIPNKPSNIYVVKDSINIFDEKNNIIGTLHQGTRVFSNNELNTPIIKGYIYGWIWAKSTLSQDNLLTIVQTENIRSRANGTIMGELIKGCFLESHYLSPSEAWYLFSKDVYISTNHLINFPLNKEETNWLKRRPNIFSTTTREGSFVIKSWLPYGTLYLYLFMSIILISLYLKIRAKKKVANEKESVYFFEILKSVLQVLSSIIIAGVIYFLGIKK